MAYRAKFSAHQLITALCFKNQFDNFSPGNYNVIIEQFKPCIILVTIMKASIIKIGNSQGVRIPKPIIEQCGFENEVELEVHDRELIIKSSKSPRQNWEAAFKAMAANGDDQLLDSETKTKWDEEEWEW